MISDPEHRRLIREQELEAVLPMLPGTGRLLEIGAGAGWQARSLAERGWKMDAVDLAGGRYDRVRVWPVQTYDGRNLPFADGSFQAVFSSNVLEHVPHLESFQAEIQRVLAPGGQALHVLPTPCWRAWTACAFYANLGRRLAARLGDGHVNRDHTLTASESREQPSSRPRGGAVQPWPRRHGARGNMIDELYLFSARRWRRFFRAAGWELVRDAPLGLFYTGHRLRGGRLSLPARRRLARVLGSSSHAYLLRKPGNRVGEA